MSSSQTLPPPQGPEYTPCGCDHIEPEHRPDAGSCLLCGCTTYRSGQPEPDRAADALVAEARRAVHEALTVLPAWEADRVRSLVADLETAVEWRTAMRAAVPAAVPPPADRADLRQRIAEAVKQTLPMSSGLACEVVAEAVLAVLPAPTDRAAVRAEAFDEAARAAEEFCYGEGYEGAAEELSSLLRYLTAGARQDGAQS